jgi:hypothetical protein
MWLDHYWMQKIHGNWKQILDYWPNRQQRILLSLMGVWDKYLYSPETLWPWKISYKIFQSWLWPYTRHGQLAKLFPHLWRHLMQEPTINKIKYLCLIWRFLLFNHKRLFWVKYEFSFFTKSFKMPIGGTVSCTWKLHESYFFAGKLCDLHFVNLCHMKLSEFSLVYFFIHSVTYVT